MQTILSFLFVLGVLIFVHELGHFLVARWYRVRVLTFSLGFGPKILKLTRGGTEYCVSIVPLGGFVKMAGETTADERQGAPDEFLSKSKWIRFQVYLAGPAMNVILAVLALTVVLSNGADVPKYLSEPPVLGLLDADGVAAKAGLQAGDRILSVNGEATRTWDELVMAVLPKANRELRVEIDRGGSRSTVSVVPASVGKYEAGSLGIGPIIRPQIQEVHAGRPAQKAGFKRGDVILAMDGQRGLDRAGLISYIQKQGEKPIAVDIERDGAIQTLSVTPEGAAGASKVGLTISAAEFTRIDPSWPQAFTMSVSQNWDNTKLIGKTLKGLFTRETPVSQLMGPVGIAELSGSAAEMGWIKLLELMSLISLQLALLNLMPIPILDGGQIAIIGLESVARRDLSLRFKEYFAMAGAAVIVALMVTVLYNDIARLIR
ncbi:MAG TPA: RIP metalloprotease RseP [Vicinamibacterales bacterium]|nr:RIP metalloprotease RseP [Vicinamibacterales bacterium]